MRKKVTILRDDARHWVNYCVFGDPDQSPGLWPQDIEHNRFAGYFKRLGLDFYKSEGPGYIFYTNRSDIEDNSTLGYHSLKTL